MGFPVDFFVTHNAGNSILRRRRLQGTGSDYGWDIYGRLLCDNSYYSPDRCGFSIPSAFSDVPPFVSDAVIFDWRTCSRRYSDSCDRDTVSYTYFSGSDRLYITGKGQALSLHRL